MITGHVTTHLEARIEVFIEDDHGHNYAIDVAIDTGYAGYLSLPRTLIASLGLPWIHKRNVILADGTCTYLDVFSGGVIWDGQSRRIDIDAVDVSPLVGMKMLAGHEVCMRVVNGGPVWIDLVP